VDRKKFIKVVSIVSASLLPVAGYIVYEITETQDSDLNDKIFNDSLNFHLLDNNLINLHFYFVNCKKSGRKLIPDNESADSFMIVRVPQMHVSEKGFWDTDWNDPAKSNPEANLSGFSYLAFKLWPNPEPGKNKKFRFDLDTILNWNDHASLELITMVEWMKMKSADSFKYTDYEKKQFNENKVWNSSIVDTEKEFLDRYYIKTKKESKSSVYKKYKSIVRHLFDNNLASTKPTDNVFIPVTFFEVPQAVCLVPISTRRDKDGKFVELQKNFWTNKLPGTYSEGHRKYEIWHNTLYYTSPLQDTANPLNQFANESSDNFKVETPSFRIAGLITNKEVECPVLDLKTCEEATADGPTHDIYPTLLDKTELAYLTQLASSEINKEKWDFSDPSYDINTTIFNKELNISESHGFFFSGLGIITHLRYYNEKAAPKIDLIEYEHIISQGRDVYIKVARIGIHNKNGKRYKHVIEGKRKINTVYDKMPNAPLQSFIELKQYCECIEEQKSYEFYVANEAAWDAGNFDVPPISTVNVDDLDRPASHPLFTPILTNKPHFRRYPWKSIHTIESKRTPIEPYQDADAKGDPVVVNSPECAFWFWPIYEGTSKNPRYFKSKSTGYDWDNGSVEIETAFIFIRKTILETNNKAELQKINDSYFKVFPNDANHPYNLRRQIAIRNNKIAFTEPMPAKPSITGEELPVNKVNILETDFIETYFNVNKSAGKSFASEKFPILPQLLRAKVYIDHIRDLTFQKFASVVEYHEDYLHHKFKEFDADLKQGNPAKIILANTDAFRGVKYIKNAAGAIERRFIETYEEIANNTYTQIKSALQEAKDKLGNLVIPDIIPDTVSLADLGITAPKEMNESIQSGKTVLSKASDGLQQIAGFNPIAILRGKLSDVCGLDLTAILDEVLPATPGANQTPLFEINKIVNKISDQIINSKVYATIKTDIQKVKDTIETTKKTLSHLLENVNNYRTQYNTALNTITEAIPNADDLRNILKTQFENLRTEALKFELENKYFTAAKGEIDSKVAGIRNLIKGEIALLKDTCRQKLSELRDFEKEIVTEVTNTIQRLPGTSPWSDLKASIDQIVRDNFVTGIVQFYKSNFEDKSLDQLISYINDDINDNITVHLSATSNDNSDLPGRTDYINSRTFEWESQNPPSLLNGSQLRFTRLDNLAGAGYIQVQKKIDDFNLFILRNINGNPKQIEFATALKDELAGYYNQLKSLKDKVQAFTGEKSGALYKLTSTINEWLTNYQDKYQLLEQQMDAETKNAIIKIKIILSRVLPYVDLLRKIDPYFYYTQRERIEKEITDNYRRIASDIIKDYDELLKSVKTEYDKVYTTIQGTGTFFDNYANAIITYEKDKIPANLQALIKERNIYVTAFKTMTDDIAKKPEDFLIEIIKKSDEYKKAYDLVAKYRKQWQEEEAKYKKELLAYEQYIKQNINSLEDNLLKQLTDYIEKHPDEIEKINEARNLYKLLTSVKQQELKYTWNTTAFRDVSLGIVSFKKFSSPDTTLKVDVKATTYFSQDKFPPSIERITTYSENRLTNFGVSFLNILTISFSEISFIAGSEQDSSFDVKIKDVRFDGALSFVQAFQNYLQTIGKGLILTLEPDHVALGYSLPIPSIKTPAFSFFNLSLNFDLRVYFDKRPMRFGFSLARADSKFGIAATIYAGFGFFGIAADPKHGIVEIECALEAGAWAGISIGPISGEVKLAFGFYYRKNEYGVRLEGYVVAEGRLTVWILEVSARIYLGIVSENSVVEGQCTVSYSVKLGFIKKSFSGTFHKRIAGAAENNNSKKKKLIEFHSELLVALAFNQGAATTSDRTISTFKLKDLYDRPDNNTPRETNLPVTEKKWKDFINTF
jgi:hypothetical protein